MITLMILSCLTVRLYLGAPLGVAAPPMLLVPCPFCSCTRVSHTFFSTRLTVGSVREHLLRQTGHSRLVPFLLQNWCRQPLQKLWLHRSTTGSAKISQHTGHDSWSSTAARELEVRARGRRMAVTLGLRSTPDLPGCEEALGLKGITSTATSSRVWIVDQGGGPEGSKFNLMFKN